MQPKDPNRPTVNPRRVLDEGSAQGLETLAGLLASAGYVIQGRILKDLKNSLRSGKPLLVEGPRGGGKTALAEALARACNLTSFYLQCTEDLTIADVLFSWDREEQREMVREEKATGAPIEQIRARKWSREFLTLGEVLAAFDYAATNDDPPVLIIDEVDKVPTKIEDMLLQLLGRGYASVPRMRGNIGTTDHTRWPIVMLLSNNIRHDLSEPLRSRCIFNWLQPPGPDQEVDILRKHVPEAGKQLVSGVVKIINYIRRDMPNVRDKPGIRESIDLLRMLVLDGVEELSAEVIDEYISFLGKKRKELFSLMQGIARLEWAANVPDPEIDEWVEGAFVDEYRQAEASAAAMTV